MYFNDISSQFVYPSYHMINFTGPPSGPGDSSWPAGTAGRPSPKARPRLRAPGGWRRCPTASRSWLEHFWSRTTCSSSLRTLEIWKSHKNLEGWLKKTRWVVVLGVLKELLLNKTENIERDMIRNPNSPPPKRRNFNKFSVLPFTPTKYVKTITLHRDKFNQFGQKKSLAVAADGSAVGPTGPAAPCQPHCAVPRGTCRSHWRLASWRFSSKGTGLDVKQMWK